MDNRKFLNCLGFQNQNIFKQSESGQMYCYSSDRSRRLTWFFELVTGVLLVCITLGCCVLFVCYIFIKVSLDTDFNRIRRIEYGFTLMKQARKDTMTKKASTSCSHQSIMGNM